MEKLVSERLEANPIAVWDQTLYRCPGRGVCRESASMLRRGGDYTDCGPTRVSLRRQWSGKLGCGAFVMFGLDPGTHSPEIETLFEVESLGELGKPV